MLRAAGLSPQWRNLGPLISAPALGWKRLYGTQTINDRIGVAANVAMKKLVAAFSNGLDITGATSSVSDVCGSPFLGSPIWGKNLIPAETGTLAPVFKAGVRTRTEGKFTGGGITRGTSAPGVKISIFFIIDLTTFFDSVWGTIFLKFLPLQGVADRATTQTHIVLWRRTRRPKRSHVFPPSPAQPETEAAVNY